MQWLPDVFNTLKHFLRGHAATRSPLFLPVSREPTDAVPVAPARVIGACRSRRGAAVVIRNPV